MNRIVTMQDFAQVLKICDSYLIRKYQTNIEQLMMMNIDNKAETILMLLLANEEIARLFDHYNLNDIMYDYLDSYSEKKIFTIPDKTFAPSRKKPYELTDEEYQFTEEQIDQIFKALEHNMELYDRMYRDKIWIIDSSIGRTEKTSISTTRFFHLMGLDERDFKDEDSMKLFESVFETKDNIRSLMKDKKDLFKVLSTMIRRETSIREAILDGTLRPVINPHKMELKNFSFERMGIIEHSSGMVFYDKKLAEQLGHYTNLQTDLILLSNFIRKYNLEFIFTTYKKYRHTPIAKDAESIFIPEDGYENSQFIRGQQVSISERARRYSPKDFEYTIRTENGEEEPLSDPEEIIEFSDIDKARMAQAIIEKVPQLDTGHLKEVYESISNSLSDYEIRK